MQGVGPYLHRSLIASQPTVRLPEFFTLYLEQEYHNNLARNRLIYSDLAAILAAANRDDIEIMPLKGVLLAQQFYPDPALRPMADIDILVRPEHRTADGQLLTNLGYRLETSMPPDFYRDKFINPGGDKIANLNGESPDNPRAVEVHHMVRRPMWGDIGDIDLTDLMWNESRVGELMGEPVRMPNRRSLLQHMLIHALEHFISSTGRAIMWLDIVSIHPDTEDLLDLQYHGLIYPMLRLAQRALPEQLGDLDLSALACSASPVIRRWCDEIPLDDRCGLISVSHLNRTRLRFARWKPEHWRLVVGYQEERYLLALLKHNAALLRKFREIVLRNI